MEILAFRVRERTFGNFSLSCKYECDGNEYLCCTVYFLVCLCSCLWPFGNSFTWNYME